MIGGLLVGVAALGALQSAIYVLLGVIAGAHLQRPGLGRAGCVIALGALAATGFGALGCVAALQTGSGEAVQGLFPLFFVFIFLSSSNLPRNLLKTGWFHTVATWNPISYLIEGFGACTSWAGTQPRWRAASRSPLGLLAVGLALVARAMRARLQRT